MLGLLAKIFIKDYQYTGNPSVQSKYITLSGALGLFFNVILFLGKLAVGLISGSIALVSDAFNNLSDCLTSIIAILGSWVSNMPADERHPYGHGRLEYVASFVVALVIMFVGFELFKESIISIRNPEPKVFTKAAIAILVVSNLIKVYMYYYNHRLAIKINSSLNQGVAKDSINDVIASSGILAAGIISNVTGFNLDGYAGLIISFFVFKTGWDFAFSTVSILLGEKPDEELIENIGKEIMKGQYVMGYHDLEVHDYGRGMRMGSVDVEIPANLSLLKAHNIIDKIERNILIKYGVTMAIHKDPRIEPTDGAYHTQVLEVIRVEDCVPCLEKAAEIIKNSGLVAIPTETVYGLAGNGLDSDAVEKIFQVKGRPSDNPMILHIGKVEDLYPLVEEVPKEAQGLIDLWPGPLTLIFKKSQMVPDIVTGGGDTVAVRMPDNEIAREIINLSGYPLAAPSANLSGRPSPTNAHDVYSDLNGKIQLIIDGGACPIGIESTVVDLSGDKPRILRPGYYGVEKLKGLLPDITYDQSLVDEEAIPKSPGQKYAHYSPKAEMILFSRTREDYSGAIAEEIVQARRAGKKVGVLTFDENLSLYDADVLLSLGREADLSQGAKILFAQLREFDRQGVDIILAEGPEEEGLGFAIMNRMKKAASGNVKY